MFFSCFILFYFVVVTSCGNASTGRHRCLPSTFHLRLCTSLDGFFCFWEPSPSLTPAPLTLVQRPPDSIHVRISGGYRRASPAAAGNTP